MDPEETSDSDQFVFFKPSLASIASFIEGESHVDRSIAISEHFKTLSLYIAQVIPDLLVKHVTSWRHSTEASVKELHSLISDVVSIEDTESFLSFFKKYSQRIIVVITKSTCLPSNLSQRYRELVEYLAKDMHIDLVRATHLDVNDLVIALKKAALKEFVELAQILHSELAKEDVFTNFLKTQLSRHEWVSKLTSMQKDIAYYLRVGKTRSLKDSERAGLGHLLDMASAVPGENVETALKMLEHYGVVHFRETNLSHHATIIISAANLSLSDTAKQWSRYKEVQYMCTGCFYVDTSMHQRKNVAIVASKVSVVKSGSRGHRIDVSGSNGSTNRVTTYHKRHTGSSDFGPGTHGQDGHHGEPGESGGNILICADDIENSKLLTLCSEGGNGSDGQHGGDGQNGKAKPSRSDDLRHFGGYDSLKIIHFLKAANFTNTFRSHYRSYLTIAGNDAYGLSFDGVEVLHGFVNTLFSCYAFIYSKGVNGVSADGGNAGKGGKAGGGGKCGHIDIYLKNGVDHNVSHSICIAASDGCNGHVGKPGKPGKRDVVESKRDYLVVDGWLKRQLRYDGFIQARPYTGKDKSRLDRGYYYCHPSVAKCFDRDMHDGYIEFFKASRDRHCPTKHNRQAEDGKAHEQEEGIIYSTPSKPIDKAKLQMEYQVLSNKHLQVQDNSSLIHFLEEMQQTLHEKLEELEKTYIKQQYKQVRRLNDSLELNPDSVQCDSDCILKLIIIEDSKATDFNIPPEISAKLDNNPLVSEEDKSTSKYSIQQKYQRLETLVERQLAQQGDGLPDEDTCKLIFQIMEVMFHPTFLFNLDRNKPLQNALAILDEAESITAPFQSDYFRSTMAGMKYNLKPRYEWLKLSQAHHKLQDTCAYTDQEFQRNSVAVYLRLCSPKVDSIDDVERQFVKCFPDRSGSRPIEIFPHKKPLQKFETSCNAALPLCSGTKSALETLMIFINEANYNSYGNYHFPDILRAVEREYEAYQSTISDPDLMFIMTYIQDRLDRLLIDRRQLEDIVCQELLSEKEELGSYIGGFILHQNKLFQIKEVRCLPRDVVQIICKPNHTFTINHLKSKVTFDREAVNPPETLLISRVDIISLWKEIELFFIKRKLPINDTELERFLDQLPFPENEYKQQLTVLLQQARLAQDIPFDVFAFCPPSNWVEKLIVSTVQKEYNKDDPNFVADVEKKISGLSRCHDKSLYFTMYTQFLQETSERGDIFKLDLLETLETMRSVFIDQNLCSLVTEQGMLQRGIEDADYVFDDLIDLHIIDSNGMFLPNITEDAINLYSKTNEIDALFLRTIFIMQRYIGELSGKELTFWTHKLRELRLRLSLQLLTGDDNTMCDTLLVHAHQMQRHYGEQKVFDFVQLVYSTSQRNISKDKLVDLFSKCSSKEWIFSTVTQYIQRSAKCENACGASPLLQALNDLHSLNWELERNKERTADEIIESIKSQLPPQIEHLFPELSAIKENVYEIKEKEKCASQLFDMDDYELKNELNWTQISKYTKHHIAHWTTKFKEVASRKRRFQNNHSLLIEAFAVIRRGITVFYETEKNAQGVVPRDTQMVATLMFFQQLSAQGSAQGTKLMQQISTGEGKTMILCMVAIYKALLGEKVDIVTSSSVLATRDAVRQRPLYDLFNVTVSHCCHEEISKRRKAYEADVIYGDIGSFQRDILETNFYDRDIRTERRFDNVFVDEVDSMLVDKGQNMLYLPHALPDMNYLDQIYLEIWSLVNASDFIGLQQEQEQLYHALKDKLFGAMAPNTFTAVPGISEERSQEIFESLMKHGIIDSNDHCLTTTNFTDIMNYVKTLIREKHILYEVLMIIQQHTEAKPLIQTIPKSLHPFIKKSLRSWIHSAVCAKYFRPNKEYIIDIDHRESASDRYPKIVIMDNETGVEQESSEWGSGLHQFLQLKHNLRLSKESLKAVYMSNISFFTKHYQNILGVTGTLGSAEEHALFKKLYEDTLLVEIPTNKPSRLIFQLPVCCSTTVEWEQAVYSDVHEKLQNNRVVLVISEDVERARRIQQFLNSRDRNLNPELYLSCHQQKLEEKGKFEPGQLIIATNLAGRGTDIKLTDEVKRNGGLHVCLSYLPPNVRVELQAYGRAARSGDPGSCRMIFHNKEGDLSYAIKKRDLSEAHRVAEIEVDYFQNIRFQESLFSKFKILYNTIRLKNKVMPERRAELDYCLDCWAFFLDSYTNDIEDIPKKSPNEAKSEKNRISQAFDSEVQRELERLKDVAINGLSLPSSRQIQLGHAFMKQEMKRGGKFKDVDNKKDFDMAVSCYMQARVSDDPFVLYYSAAAQLNKSFHNKNTMSDKGITERRALKQAFKKIVPLFQHKIRQCQTQTTMLQLANRHQDQTVTGNGQYFQEQKQHEIEFYNQFISSMQDVIGREITPSVFEHADWGEEGAMVLFNIVHKEFSLKNPRIAKNYHGRLDSLLSRNGSYFTYEAKIRERVSSLKGMVVKRDSFDRVVPDKADFWSLLKKKRLITREIRTPGSAKEEEEDVKGNAQRNELIGYWNPKIDIKGVQLDSWDCIDTHSFDWIDGLTEDEKIHILYELKGKRILSAEGQLLDLNVAKPFELFLRDKHVKQYKAIKDTLWHHAIYRFILDHLNGCAEIDKENELSDYKAKSKAIDQRSVVEILISLNPNANVSSEGKVKHIVESALKGLKRITSASADVSEYEDDLDILSFKDHVPTDVINDRFVQQLTDNNMISTYVSGSGLNCMINAMMQHAKRDYQTPNFIEADEVRRSVKIKHPYSDLSGMLHCDDEVASEVLICVNDKCSSNIGTVSVCIASVDGPILYAGTSDKRYTSGRHVVLWQQGNHFVSLVHHDEFVQSSNHVDSDEMIDFEKEIPLISKAQFEQLKRMEIVSKSKADGKYRICKSIDEIESTLNGHSLSPKDRDQMTKFLTFKLEVDFKTLSNSPRVLDSNTGQVLYDDLCQYAVVKEVKMKKTSKEIDNKLSELKIEDSYWYKDAGRCVAEIIPFYLNKTILNKYIKRKNIQMLTDRQYADLKSFLCSGHIVDHVVSYTRERKFESAVTVVLCP